LIVPQELIGLAIQRPVLQYVDILGALAFRNLITYTPSPLAAVLESVTLAMIFQPKSLTNEFETLVGVVQFINEVNYHESGARPAPMLMSREAKILLCEIKEGSLPGRRFDARGPVCDVPNQLRIRCES
jgi:hypothetical protein